MVAEQNLVRVDADLLLQQALDPELFADIGGHGFAPEIPRTREGAQRGLQDAPDLHHRFFVEDDVIQVSAVDATLFQTEINGARWEAAVVFFAGEPLLHRGGDQLAIAE